ncbi:hemolysin-type calcium-binding repeat family protein [Lyngbya aestuarii BL J]|uniref:Hemolysin-type calcium-binding repeat family protein n=1 Tax=Lyngbya aestuarii BL J TaxID=1348334 RepID=U7QF23_9CYAN|nr:Ig-like domain-containing protein [Lyngbya aestuarii]ERT06544.1 hemolysin-type calcium-binding repeat family protein [Lyngbya aestuarii BL J]
MIEINGTPGNDNLLGTSEADVIFALTGDDIISGLGGGDSLFGFRGNDTINGNEGNDTLFGNQNLDLLIGDSGEDWLFGGKEADIIEDGEGEDQLFGNLGDDLLRGGAGNDQRYGGKDNDTVIGGTGNDQVFGDRGNDILWGVDVDAVNPGIDEIDILTGGLEQDIFVLGDQSRLYYIGSGNNDFALITDFNVIEDQINIGNNQVTYTETVLNEFGLGVAIFSQNNDLIAFVQNATINQFITGSNVVEPPQTEEAIPRQIEESQFPEVIVPTPTPAITPTPTPVVITPTPTPTPDPIITPTPTPVVITPTPTPTPDPVTPPTPTPDPITPPTPTPDPVTPPTPTPDPITPTPTPDPVTPTPTPDPVTPTPTPDPVTPPTPTPDPEPEPNTPPAADNDNYSTSFQSPIAVDAVSGVLNGDGDVDGNPLTAILVNSPTNGTVNLNPNGSFSYTPNSGFSGVDSFTYTANDGESNSNVATVTIDVEPRPNTPPVADNDNYTTGFQSPITVDASVGVLNGDTDAEGDPITATLVNSPTNGSLNLNGNGSFTYTPNSGFSGVDSFTYTANDGESNSNVATVTIDVEPRPNTPPVADNDNYTTGFQSPLIVDAVSSVLNGDSDAEGDAISAILVSSPANGSLDYFKADGSFSYIPNSQFFGVDSFIYVANDGKDDSNVATVTINVGERPNTPPEVNNDSYTTPFDSQISVNSVPSVLNNDSDGDGDVLTARLVDLPNQSTIGNVTLKSDGSFSYTPKTGYSGIDTFTYIANDGKVDSNNIATVTINIEEPPNTPPVAYNDNNYTTSFDSRLNVAASVGVLNNDTDLDGDAISAILVSSPANGSLDYFKADGSFSYIPNSQFFGVDSFIYVANDGKDDSNVATVTINVEPPQPEEQTRTFNGYSQRATDDENILSTFLLTNKGNDGQTIYDRTIDTNEDGIIDDNEIDSNPNLGFFPQAIQNFIKYNPLIVVPDPRDPIDFDGNTQLEDGGVLSFNNEGKPIFTETDNQPEFTQIPVVDLRVKRVIGQENIIAELGLNDEFELVYFDVSGLFSERTVKLEFNLEFNLEDNVIEVTDNYNNQTEIYSFPEEIIIYEFLEEKEDGTREIIDEFIVRYDNIQEISSLALATNSLEYIIDENLLSYTEGKSTVISDFLANYLLSLQDKFFEKFRFGTQFYLKESDDFNNLLLEEPIEETILVQPDIV